MTKESFEAAKRIITISSQTATQSFQEALEETGDGLDNPRLLLLRLEEITNELAQHLEPSIAIAKNSKLQP